MLAFMFGMLVGILIGGLFSSWYIKFLRRNGYIKFDITDKFKNEFKEELNGK